MTPKKQTKAPDYLLKRLGITQRQWKEKKRRELKQVIDAFDKYHLGCAYAPHAEEGLIGRITSDLQKLKRALSVKEWGR